MSVLLLACCGWRQGTQLGICFVEGCTSSPESVEVEISGLGPCSNVSKGHLK